MPKKKVKKKKNSHLVKQRKEKENKKSKTSIMPRKVKREREINQQVHAQERKKMVKKQPTCPCKRRREVVQSLAATIYLPLFSLQIGEKILVSQGRKHLGPTNFPSSFFLQPNTHKISSLYFSPLFSILPISPQPNKPLSLLISMMSNPIEKRKNKVVRMTFRNLTI